MLEENQKILGLHHPSEIATVGGFESGGRLYRIAVHGFSLNDREEPHFHIYLDTEEGRDYLNPPFNFEISLRDLLCGDIISSTYEFNPITTPDSSLLPPGSTFTDDTVMTCAVAEWLMKGGNLSNILQSWGELHGDIGYYKKNSLNGLVSPLKGYMNCICV